jgi:hypothetical protein
MAAVRLVQRVPGFSGDTAYETFNRNVLARLQYPLELDFEDVRPLISMDRILKKQQFQEIDQAEAVNAYFTMPEQLASYWLEVKGRMAWAFQPAAGRNGDQAEHYTLHTLTLTQNQTEAGCHIQPNGNWVSAPCGMGMFAGWQAKEAIFTVFEGRTVYLAANFHDKRQGTVKMLQCATMPSLLEEKLLELSRTSKGQRRQ